MFGLVLPVAAPKTRPEDGRKAIKGSASRLRRDILSMVSLILIPDQFKPELEVAGRIRALHLFEVGRLVPQLQAYGFRNFTDYRLRVKVLCS